VISAEKKKKRVLEGFVEEGYNLFQRKEVGPGILGMKGGISSYPKKTSSLTNRSSFWKGLDYLGNARKKKSLLRSLRKPPSYKGGSSAGRESLSEQINLGNRIRPSHIKGSPTYAMAPFLGGGQRTNHSSLWKRAPENYREFLHLEESGEGRVDLLRFVRDF